MSSDVMPIEPEPPPLSSALMSLSIVDPNALIRSEHRGYYDKNTRALHDTGVDDCTTDNPYIIFSLQLLPMHLWIKLYDAGRNVHHSKYGGFSFLLMRDGSMKKFMMRYTPTMKITAIDISKLRDPTLVCVREGELIDHKNEVYSYVWSYENDITHVLPLTKFCHEERRIKRYYTGPFEKVDKTTATMYNEMLMNVPLSTTPVVSGSNPSYLSRQVQV